MAGTRFFSLLLSCSCAIKFDPTSTDVNWAQYKTNIKVLRGATGATAEIEVGETLTSADGSFKAQRWPMNKPPPGLLHEAHPPCEARGQCDLVMGLASYQNAMPIFQAMVGTLRYAGYDGHVVLGVHPEIDEKEKKYLISQHVTFYATGTTACNLPFKTEHQGNVVRDKCSEYLPHMKLEWARYEMALHWLVQCKTCNGWTLVADTRDIFFQATEKGKWKSFTEFLGPPPTPAEVDKKDVYLVEEYQGPPHGVTNAHWFSWASIHKCYGKAAHDVYKDKPMLCSGTTIGSREGTIRYLKAIVDEFYDDLMKVNVNCVPPVNIDQPVHNYLYYHKRFGARSSTLAWGRGPIYTIGFPCQEGNKHSLLDVVKRDSNGYVLDLDGKIPPIIHQWDRCEDWLTPWLKKTILSQLNDGYVWGKGWTDGQ
jgi:hypothetical protein